MKFSLAALLLILLVGCSGSFSDAPSPLAHGGPQPWTSRQFNNSPDDFQFAIVGDRTGRARPGVFEKGIAKLNLLRPEFVMSVGDLIEGYTKDEGEIDEQWDQIEGFVSKLEAPFFYVPGNHDISNSVQAKEWASRFGDAYYHFVYRDVLFLAVNTSDPQSQLSSEQIAYFAKVLKENANVRWTCVFMHEPLWDYKTPTRWEEFEKLLLDRQYTVFAGHHHTYTKYVRHDRRYLVLATTGGGMKGRGESAELGTFDHVTWVTMLPDGPRVAHIEPDAIHDEDVRTEEMANLVNRVFRGEVMRINPILVKDETFSSGAASIELPNESDVPVIVSGTVSSNAALRAEPDKFEVTVRPHSTGKVDLKLRAEPATVAQLAPMTVQWAAAYQLAGREPLRVPREDVLAVERVASCPSRNAPVKVDGKLDEWTSFPQTYRNNTSDAGYQFAVEHDDGYVYIAVKTSDDHLVLNPNKAPWSQDGVEVRFDARPEPQRSLGRGRGEMKEILVVSMSPGETLDKMVLYNREQIPAGVIAVCARTETGHAAEIAIPVSYLNDQQGGAWSGFRLNICVDDYDHVAGPLKAHWWRPDWRSPETFSGSGTFERK